jgi:hypothetical protein
MPQSSTVFHIAEVGWPAAFGSHHALATVRPAASNPQLRLLIGQRAVLKTYSKSWVHLPPTVPACDVKARRIRFWKETPGCIWQTEAK